MHIISFLQCFIASLASINALTGAYAAPLPLDKITLQSRATTVTVDGVEVVLGQQISPLSHSKSTVWRVDTWDGKSDPGYVIKIYNSANLNAKEITGLKAVGQYVASDAQKKAVVMKEVPGKTLSEMVAAIPADQRQALVHQWKPKVAAAAADIATTDKVYHGDLNMNNVIIDGDKVQFIDWEHFTQPGEPGFTTDKNEILKTLELVWDSTATPPEFKNPQSTNKPPTSPKPNKGPSVAKPTTEPTPSDPEPPTDTAPSDSEAPTDSTPSEPMPAINPATPKAPIPKPPKVMTPPLGGILRRREVRMV